MIFKIFAVVMAVSAWAQKAFDDGVIERDEVLDLLNKICDALKIDFEIKIEKGD